jgi:hypothetical protein
MQPDMDPDFDIGDESAGDESGAESSDSEPSPRKGPRPSRDSLCAEILELFESVFAAKPSPPRDPPGLVEAIHLTAEVEAEYRCVSAAVCPPMGSTGPRLTRRRNIRTRVCASCGCRCSYREVAVDNVELTQVRACPMVHVLLMQFRRAQIPHIDQLILPEPDPSKHSVAWRGVTYHLHPAGVDRPGGDGSDVEPTAQVRLLGACRSQPVHSLRCTGLQGVLGPHEPQGVSHSSPLAARVRRGPSPV